MKRENLTNQGAKDRIATMFCLTSLLQRAERIACKLRWLRNLNDDGCAKDEQLPSVIVNAPAVINGPFAGLIYPENRSVGSRLWPKKLGSYEHELHPLIYQLCKTKYEFVIDVGCAEGYYAIGLARAIPSTMVYAFDINPIARSLCAAMAELNDVGDRVVVGAECGAEQIVSLTAQFRRGLVMLDCEGSEVEILTDLRCKEGLASHDILVECHDFIRPQAAAIISKAYRDTHAILKTMSVPDTEKAITLAFPEMSDLALETRLEVVRENRPCRMQWLFLKSRCSKR
jgi:hypothetical protein